MAILIVGCWDWLLLEMVCCPGVLCEFVGPNALQKGLKKMKRLAGQPFFSFFKSDKRGQETLLDQPKYTPSNNHTQTQPTIKMSAKGAGKGGKGGKGGRGASGKKSVSRSAKVSLTLLSHVDECLYVILHCSTHEQLQCTHPLSLSY